MLCSEVVAEDAPHRLPTTNGNQRMTYSESEARHFYWHCVTTAKLLEHLDLNTATRAHVNNAIRMATLTAIGKDGIRYASRSALAKRDNAAATSRTTGLIREHVVPISVISRRVLSAKENDTPVAWRDLIAHLTQEDLGHWQVIDSDSFRDSRAPLSAIVASIVRELAVLAWITTDENVRLRENGLAKRMPGNGDGGVFSRYTACKIEWVDLQEQPAA